jgi:hypothetical protein
MSDSMKTVQRSASAHRARRGPLLNSPTMSRRAWPPARAESSRSPRRRPCSCRSRWRAAPPRRMCLASCPDSKIVSTSGPTATAAGVRRDLVRTRSAAEVPTTCPGQPVARPNSRTPAPCRAEPATSAGHLDRLAARRDVALGEHPPRRDQANFVVVEPMSMPSQAPARSQPRRSRGARRPPLRVRASTRAARGTAAPPRVAAAAPGR